MAVVTPTAKAQFIDAAGVPLAGGLLYTYAAGTTTPQATYTDSTGATANSNPIVLDARGEANIWLGSATYKFKLCDANNTELWTVDNISAPTSGLSPVLSGNVTISSSSSGPALSITQSGTGALIKAPDATNPALTLFTVDNTGHIGIGTASPGSEIDVAGGTIQVSASGGTARSKIYADATNSYYTAEGARAAVITANSTNLIYAASNGYVGIRNASPTVELDVTGRIKTSGSIAGGSTISSAGALTVSAGGAAITGNSTVTGTLTSTGALTVSAGGAGITGNSTVTGTLTATSTLTAQNGLTVSAGGAGITGNSTVTGTLTSTSTLTAQNGLTVSAGGAAVTGNSSVTGTLFTTGAFSADTVQGRTSANTITVGGIAIVSSQIPAANRLITAATSQATTSGTSFNFSSIPSWVKRITFMMNAVSTNGTIVRIRLGTGGSPATSGYNSICGVGGGSVVSTAGFDLSLVNATYDLSGSFTFTNITGNTWVVDGVAALNVGANTITLGGAIALGGVLNILQVTSSTGTDTFDAGTINILYE
jgi:hypothetical protein